MRYKFITIIACFLSACGGDEAAPEFMTVDALALVYETKIGDEVLLEGRLGRDSNGEYYLAQLASNRTDNRNEGFQVHVSFANDNVDHDLINPCIGDATVVTGSIEEAYRIRAKRMKRTADARVHKFISCYVHD